MARNFTDTESSVTSDDSTVEADAQAPESTDNEASSTTEASETPKLTPAQRVKLAQDAWDAAVDTLDNGGSVDPVELAAVFANAPTPTRTLTSISGTTFGQLAVSDPTKITPLALLKTQVDNVLSTVPEKASGPSPESVRAGQVTAFARQSYVRACVDYALAASEYVLNFDDLTEDEKTTFAAFEPTKSLISDLDNVGKALAGIGRKSGSGGGSGTPSENNKSASADFEVPGNTFVHTDKSGAVTASLVVNADGSFTMTRSDNSAVEFPQGTSASKIASTEAGGNRNGYAHWSLQAV